MRDLRLKENYSASEYFFKRASVSARYIERFLVISEAKQRFGKSYDRATMWYSLIHKIPIKKFKPEDYDMCYNQWHLMIALDEMVGTIEIENGSTKDVLNLEQKYIEKTFMLMQKLFGVESSASSEEDQLEFIHMCLNQFKRQTQREVLHKASCRVIKMDFTDLMNYGQGFVFDSRKAGSSDTSMRWILTSEDGISRILSSMGKEQVIIKMDTASLEDSPEKIEAFRQMKETIFKDGITDVANGKHYLCSAPSASSTRHCDFPFVVASHPQEIYDLWCEITGFSDITELASNIGSCKDGLIQVVFAKLKARVAQNGANSLSTGKTSTDRIRNRLRSAKVVFVPDCKGTINIPYKKITSIGVLSMEHSDGTITEERV